MRYALLFATFVALFWPEPSRAADAFILHTPAHPAPNQPVVYTATADTANLSSIEIWEQISTPSSCSRVPCWIAGAETVIKMCNSGSGQISPCPHTVTAGYPDQRLIRYRAKATYSSGATVEDGYVHFLVGAHPWSQNEPIPVYARGYQLQSQHVDLVIIPDTNYGAGNAGFMTDVTAMLTDVFLSTKNSAAHLRANRAKWNFYLTYQQGTARCLPVVSHVPPPNWTTLRATVNSGFILHHNEMNDCSGIGEGTLFSAEPLSEFPSDPAKLERAKVVPVHEMGHSIFSLADEYEGGYMFWPNETYLQPHHNVFDGVNGCNKYARDSNKCQQIGRSKWRRAEDAADVMKDTTTTANFFMPDQDGERAKWKYNQCTAGQCVQAAAAPSKPGGKEPSQQADESCVTKSSLRTQAHPHLTLLGGVPLLENEGQAKMLQQHGLPRVLVASFTFLDGDGAELGESRIETGMAGGVQVSEACDVMFSVRGEHDKELARFGIWDPLTTVLDDGEKDKKGPQKAATATYVVRIPLDKQIREIVVLNKQGKMIGSGKVGAKVKAHCDAFPQDC